MAGSTARHGFSYSASPDVQTPIKGRTVGDTQNASHSPSISARVSSPARVLASVSTGSLPSSRSCYVHARPLQASQEHIGNMSKGSSANIGIRTPSYPASYAGSDGGGSLRAPSVPAVPRNARLSDTSGSMKVPAGVRQASPGSVAASSACDSQQDSSEPASTRVLYAKASELIRIEIAAVERRMTARVEAERADRKKACDKMAYDLEAIVTIVEGLSSQADRPSVDVLLEEERHLRDMACGSLHSKLEALASKLQTLQNQQKLVCIKEDSVDILFDQEKEARNALECSLQESEDGASIYVEPNDRKRRDLDEQYLNALLAKESRERDVALAILRKELRQELEAMAMDVRSMAVRAPLFDSMEKQQKELEGMFCKLRDDIQAIKIQTAPLTKESTATDNKYIEPGGKVVEKHSATPPVHCQAGMIRDGKRRSSANN